MQKPTWMFALCMLCLVPGQVAAFFEWMKRSVTPDSTATPPDLSAGVPAFEMTTADERFLAEAKQLELSPLESCHYKVVVQLKSSCSSLSEEELGKLGVALFNCQAAAEGRRTYLCTPEMTLKQCTAEMDPDTWNAYHIVSNRARSVCYATRHLQFRKKTEMTVNSLISTATNQLDTMKALKDGQRELKELTSASLDKVLSSQSSLLEQQSVLQEGQSKLETSIDTNLERLAQERALIASGQQLVAQLIENITWRMENVSKHLKDQSVDLEDGHKAILSDLAEVRIRAQEIYSKIESNAAGFVVYQNRTVHYYEQLMSNLQRMNTTLGNLADFVDSMHNSMEHRLQHIQSFISWAGFNLATLSTCILHSGYFLLAALLMSFLQTPGFSRAVLLVLVVLNALAELNHQTAMDFRSLSVFLIITAIGNWFLLKLAKGYALSRHQSKPLAMPLTCSTSKYETKCDGIYSSTPKEKLFKEEIDSPLTAMEHDSFLFEQPLINELSTQVAEDIMTKKMRRQSEGLPNHSTPVLKKRASLPLVTQEVLPQRQLASLLETVSELRNTSLNQSVASNESTSGRYRCSGFTKTGQPCKNRVAQGQEFCRVHESINLSKNTSGL
ncbi:protein brambleberry [Erpetoichthys calabaricus]|uniref:Brambleberry n=1 Tax=Erpetoichthys calabaricus TaxID=27687 RepID=A0A8C4SNI0_ERPCA|nr:protein brambleberry [Erpetoichthys calabaricus]